MIGAEVHEGRYAPSRGRTHRGIGVMWEPREPLASGRSITISSL